jgi:hypothetical protein
MWALRAPPAAGVLRMTNLGWFPKAGGAEAAADSRLGAAASGASPAASSGADCVSRSGGACCDGEGDDRDSGLGDGGCDCVAEASSALMATATS